MKLVMTIVSNKDSEKVLSVLSQNGYFATKVSTTGQFLVGGHSAILIGCKDEEVEKLYELLKANITKELSKLPALQAPSAAHCSIRQSMSRNTAQLLLL